VSACLKHISGIMYENSGGGDHDPLGSKGKFSCSQTWQHIQLSS